MTPLANSARQFWNAALFLRRANRNPELALKILRHLAHQPPGPIQTRAVNVIGEHYGKHPSRNHQ